MAELTVIGSALGKSLALLDEIASYFVTVTGLVLLNGQCGNFLVFNVEITPCGESVMTSTVGLIQVGLWAVNVYVLPGLAGLLTT
jgi:hypothetical protein